MRVVVGFILTFLVVLVCGRSREFSQQCDSFVVFSFIRGATCLFSSANV